MAMSSLRFEFEGKWYELSGQDRTPREGEHYLVLNRVHYCSQPGAIIPYLILREIKEPASDASLLAEARDSILSEVTAAINKIQPRPSGPIFRQGMEEGIRESLRTVESLRQPKTEAGEREGAK